jgi:hypothetical protein
MKDISAATDFANKDFLVVAGVTAVAVVTAVAGISIVMSSGCFW